MITNSARNLLQSFRASIAAPSLPSSSSRITPKTQSHQRPCSCRLPGQPCTAIIPYHPLDTSPFLISPQFLLYYSIEDVSVFILSSGINTQAERWGALPTVICLREKRARKTYRYMQFRSLGICSLKALAGLGSSAPVRGLRGTCRACALDDSAYARVDGLREWMAGLLLGVEGVVGAELYRASKFCCRLERSAGSV